MGNNLHFKLFHSAILQWICARKCPAYLNTHLLTQYYFTEARCDPNMVRLGICFQPNLLTKSLTPYEMRNSLRSIYKRVIVSYILPRYHLGHMVVTLQSCASRMAKSHRVRLTSRQFVFNLFCDLAILNLLLIDKCKKYWKN